MDERAISISSMKSGEPFDLPLSEHMVGLAQDALRLGNVFYPNAEWLRHAVKSRRSFI